MNTNPNRCSKCGSFISPGRPCQKCGTSGIQPVSGQINKKPGCVEHEWLNQLDPETGEPARICQNCGEKRAL